MNKLILDVECCEVCCECINICSQDVLGIREGKVAIMTLDDCTFCEECVDICPTQAIRVEYDITM